MEVIDFLLAQAMAYEATLIALIRTHPDGQVLAGAIRKAASELSARALQGEQPAGIQAAFDQKVALLLQANG